MCRQAAESALHSLESNTAAMSTCNKYPISNRTEMRFPRKFGKNARGKALNRPEIMERREGNKSWSKRNNGGGSRRKGKQQKDDRSSFPAITITMTVDGVTFVEIISVLMAVATVFFSIFSPLPSSGC